MISIVLYDTKQNECLEVEKAIRDSIARIIDIETEVSICNNFGELMDIAANHPIEDIGYIDVMGTEGIEAAIDFRKKYGNAAIVLIADSHISPITYIRPEIMASSLVLRPIENKDIHEVVYDFLNAFFRNILTENEEEYVISSKGSVTKIPYRKIDYIEAREKKVFFRVGDNEYSEYTTLDRILEKLPENFVRCHRSYVINMKRITSVKNAENIVVMDNGMTVPMSRGCKKTIMGSI